MLARWSLPLLFLATSSAQESASLQLGACELAYEQGSTTITTSCAFAPGPGLADLSAENAALKLQVADLTKRIEWLEKWVVVTSPSPPPFQPPPPPASPPPPPPCGPDAQSCPNCSALKANGFGSGVYKINPAGDEFEVYCSSDGWARVLHSNAISHYQGSGAYGSASSTPFKNSDDQITQIIESGPGGTAGIRFQCGSFYWRVDDWAASGIDANGGWTMQVPGRTSWYQGYQIGSTYGEPGNAKSTALETRLSNAYGLSYPPCRVHESGDYTPFIIWVMN